MRSTKFLFLVTVSLLANSSLFANDKGTMVPGYVVTNKGDTLRGLILLKDHFFNTRNCVFKESSTSINKTFLPNEISAYGNSDKYYKVYEVSIGSGSAKVFLEGLVNGTVSLFQFDNRFFVENLNIINELTVQERQIEKEGRTFTTIIETYKVILNEVMKECTTIFGLVKDAKLNKKDLLKVFSDYYNCVGQTYHEFRSTEYKIDLDFIFSVGSGISAAIVNSNEYPPYLSLDGKMSDYSMPTIVSGLLEFSKLSHRDRVAARIGFNLIWSRNMLHYNSSAGQLNYDLTCASTRIEVPLSIKYSLKNSDEGLYFLGTIGINSFLNWSESIIITSSTTGNVQGKHSDIDQAKLFPSIAGGLGYNFNFSKTKLFVEFDYNRTLAIAGKLNRPYANFIILGFKAGIRF